jgi:FixJ family two-component response regulator
MGMKADVAIMKASKTADVAACEDVIGGYVKTNTARLPFGRRSEEDASISDCSKDPTSNDKAIVHVIDDDESLRHALDLMPATVDLQVRTYESASRFLDSHAWDSFGCIVLDVRLPGVSGLDFQSQLADLGIPLPVIMMTAHGDVPMSVRAMKAGAVDFLAKPFRAQDMIDAVLAAIGRDRQRRQADGTARALRDRFATLSGREKQVVMLVTAGMMNKQAAGDLGISEITVKVHRAAAMRKMCATSLADLVRMADIIRRQST